MPPSSQAYVVYGMMVCDDPCTPSLPGEARFLLSQLDLVPFKKAPDIARSCTDPKHHSASWFGTRKSLSPSGLCVGGPHVLATQRRTSHTSTGMRELETLVSKEKGFILMMIEATTMTMPNRGTMEVPVNRMAGLLGARILAA